jgi:hypothetical protein
MFLIITGYKLLFNDWRGYLMALFALVWVANQYMSIYARLRLDIQHERVAIKTEEKKKPGFLKAGPHNIHFSSGVAADQALLLTCSRRCSRSFCTG